MNWIQRINAAETNGHFQPKDKGYARSWQFCAISEHSQFLKHDLDEMHSLALEEKLTRKALNLGTDFEYAVINDDYVSAKEIYYKIQGIVRLVR